MGRIAPYVIFAVSMALGMPEAIRFQRDGNPQSLWLCAIWGLVAGGGVALALLNARRARGNGPSRH